MKQKVAIVSLTFNEKFGGAEVIAFDHAVGLQKAGFEVSVFAGTNKSQNTREDLDGIKIYRTPVEEISWTARSYKCLRNIKVEKTFKEYLHEVKPEAVHFHNLYYKFPYSLFTIAKRSGAQVLWTVHDVGSFNYGKLTHYIDPTFTEVPKSFNYHSSWLDSIKYAGKTYNPLRNIIIKRHIKNVDTVVTVSRALKDALSDNGISADQVIHNGIDAAPWQKTANSKALRQQLGIGDKPVLLYIGRLTGAKGRNVLLKALKFMPKAVLLIVGENIYQGLDKALAEHQLNDRVRYVPPVKRHDLLPYYNLASVVVVPSVCFDSFPTVNLEAMACHRPVVASCFGGSLEIVEDGVTGYIVNPYNTNLLADKINTLIQNESLASKFGEAGYRRVVEEFNIDQWIDKLKLLYSRQG